MVHSEESILRLTESSKVFPTASASLAFPPMRDIIF